MDRVQTLDLLPKYTSSMERNKSCVYIPQREKFLSLIQATEEVLFHQCIVLVFVFFFPQKKLLDYILYENCVEF